MDKPNVEQGEKIIKNLLGWLRLDTDHPDLRHTPYRMAKMYLELFEGKYKGEPEITVFDNDEEYQDMVIVKNIDFNSVCAHHFLPFMGQAHVGYIPNESYIGLSKIARVIEHFAKKPQVQERLTTQVADYLNEKLNPQGIVVIMEAKHTCMTLRGVRKANSLTTTSAIRGDIDKNELISLLD